MSDMGNLPDYLSSKGIQTWIANGPEITAHCFFDCTSDKGKGKLYLNTETWFYDCKRCGAHGGRHLLLAHFGDADPDQGNYVPGSDPASRMTLLTQFADLTAQLLSANDEKLMYLLRRGLSAETIMDARLGFVPRGMSICGSIPGHSPKEFEPTGMLRNGLEFHAGRITIPYRQRGKVLQIRGKEIGGRYYTPPGEQVRLYNADALNGADNVLIVEGEFDTLITEQALRHNPHSRNHTTAVVGLPGAGAWPGGKERFAEYFRTARRVYIGLDPDETGIREAAKLKDAIGSKSRIVRLPADETVADAKGQPVKCDWTEYLRTATPDSPWGGHDATHIDDLISEAEQSGRRIYAVPEAAAKWRRDRSEKPGIKLGFPSLDTIMAPGLRPGNVMVPMAKTGTGKTVFLANIDWYTRERRVLHLTLENTVTELYEVLRRIHGFWEPTADEFDAARQFPLLRIADENRVTREDIGTLVEEYASDVGEPPELLIIDYLGYMAKGCRGSSSYEKTTNAIMDVKSIAKEFDLAAVVPSQVSRGVKDGAGMDGDEARDSGVVEETADFQVGLYRPADAVDAARQLAAGSVSAELLLKLLKSRRGGKGRICALASSPASLVVVDQTNRVAYNRILQEVEAYNRGASYEEIRSRRRQVALRDAQMALV